MLKRRGLALLLLLALCLGLSAAATSQSDYEAIYRWNSSIVEKRLVNDASLALYCEPMILSESDDPAIIQQAQAIVAGLDDDYDKAFAIHNWVASNVWYDYDALDDLTTPSGSNAVDVLENRRAVCQGYAALCTALLKAAGIPSFWMGGYLYGEGETLVTFLSERVVNPYSTHAWVDAYINGQWVIMDPTWDSPNQYWQGEFSEQGESKQMHFDMPLDKLSESRIYMPQFSGKIVELWYPDGLETVGVYECALFSTLQRVYFPDSVTAIKDFTFLGCSGLKYLQLPPNLQSLGFLSFGNCTALRTVVLPNSVTVIGEMAFNGCTNLESVYIPPSVTELDPEVFGGAAQLTVYGADGSYAESFAAEQGYGFVACDTALDTAHSWARAQIVSALDKGIVPVELQHFYQMGITREEFCRMAVRYIEYAAGQSVDEILAERGLVRDVNAFADTCDEDILAAYALGVTNGTGSGLFSPDSAFTREQAATMLMNTCRALGWDINAPEAPFGDRGSLPSWARAGVDFCAANAIMEGTGGGLFSPLMTYSREQSILTFDRMG